MFRPFYSPMESATGLEPVPYPWQGHILPLYDADKMAVPTRFELAIFAVTERHVRPLHHETIGWSYWI